MFAIQFHLKFSSTGHQQIHGHCVCGNAFEYSKVYSDSAVGYTANYFAEQNTVS